VQCNTLLCNLVLLDIMMCDVKWYYYCDIMEY
jgi:hypothetical protein